MNQAIANLAAVSSTYFAMKPLRKSFKQSVVKDADGNVISPFEWAVLTKGHHAATVLKKTGFHQETVFDKEAYEKTKNAFYVMSMLMTNRSETNWLLKLSAKRRSSKPRRLIVSFIRCCLR